MNFEYFKKLINSLSDNIKEVNIIDSNGNKYLFDITKNDKEYILKDEDCDLYFILNFEE